MKMPITRRNDNYSTRDLIMTSVKQSMHTSFKTTIYTIMS